MLIYIYRHLLVIREVQNSLYLLDMSNLASVSFHFVFAIFSWTWFLTSFWHDSPGHDSDLTSFPDSLGEVCDLETTWTRRPYIWMPPANLRKIGGQVYFLRVFTWMFPCFSQIFCYYFIYISFGHFDITSCDNLSFTVLHHTQIL